MPVPFNHISLQLAALFTPGTSGREDIGRIAKYISDLYGMCMNGYKPPYCSIVILRPDQNETPLKIKKTGSIITVALFFDKEKFDRLNKSEKYLHLLNFIQEGMLQVSNRYQWNRLEFERTYQLVLEKEFIFSFNYPVLLSKSRQMSAFLCIEKDEWLVSVYANITTERGSVKVKLYDKANSFLNDCSAILVRHARWLDEDRFGIDYKSGEIAAWYSLSSNKVSLVQANEPVKKIDFRKSFWMQFA